MEIRNDSSSFRPVESTVPPLVPAAMGNALPHISVCICTYLRPELLRRLLTDLAQQETAGRFTFSIVIADNDRLKSAEAVVAEFASSPIAIKYCVEPQRNISLTRNTAVRNAEGDFIAFIDDDEIPTPRWLLTLFEALHQYEVDGALGPVFPQFDTEPPRWVRQSKLYDRPSYPTGFIIDWKKGRTGNVLLKKQVFAGEERPFRPEFLTGEDQDFFRRMIDKGFVFVWCHEALAHEIEPPMRWKRGFVLRRALLRGKVSIVHPTFGSREVVKSLVAVPAYSAVLPFTLLWGQGKFMSYLIKLCDHLGRLLALLGINLVKDPYVTE